MVSKVAEVASGIEEVIAIVGGFASATRDRVVGVEDVPAPDTPRTWIEEEAVPGVHRMDSS
jgi:hypothetical protein